jgi:hypothetical protein
LTRTPLSILTRRCSGFATSTKRWQTNNSTSAVAAQEFRSKGKPLHVPSYLA